MKNNKGFTLVEVIISLMILSISLVVFISLFGNAVTQISDSKSITNETFALQEKMENKIINDKKGFVEGTLIEDYQVSIFSGDYQSDVPVAEIEEAHSSGRRYITLVSDIEIVETKLPEVEYFEVGAYLDSDTYYNTDVFPWYEDDIVLGAKFKIKDDPIIFENRERWYRSKDNINNPVYTSEYDIVSEVKVEEPSSSFEVRNEIKKTDFLENNRFYYFELRPYSLAGRVAHFINDQRILVLSKPTNTYWKEFIEEIYPKTSSGDTINYSVGSEVVYAEVMQNPEVATLDLNWSGNIDSEGALIGTLIPIDNTDDFNIKIDFQVDNDTLQLTPDNLGLGMFLGGDDNNNTGYMITFDVINNELKVNTISSGNYDPDIDILSINLLEDSRFEDFIKTVDEEDVFMWDELFSLNMFYVQGTTDSVNFALSYKDDDDNIINSGLIQFDYSNTDPEYVGLKAYSSLDYILDFEDITLNEYERNYSTHFYDLNFVGSSMIRIDETYFIGRSSLMIEFDESVVGLIENEDIALSNGTVIDIINMEDNKILVLLNGPLSRTDMDDGITMNINNNIEIDNSTKTILGRDQIVFDEDFENYNDSAEFDTEYVGTTGWSKYGSGVLAFSDSDGRKRLKKTVNNDPNGGYKDLDQEITNGYVFDGWINRSAGTNQDRFEIGNGDPDGYGVAMTGSQLRIERRSNGNATNISDSSIAYNRLESIWYRVVFISKKDSNDFIARVYDDSGYTEVTATDNTYTSFTRFYVHGGHDFDLDDLSIGIFK